jgi:hypothetical protein
MSASTLSPSREAPAPYFSGLPGVFHVASVVTLATGIVLHGSRLFVGPEAFSRTIFTPLVDSIFAVPMIIAGVAMLMLWRRAILPSLPEKIVYGFVTIFFLGSMVLHARTILTWDTSYVNVFPSWYPILAAIYLGLMCAFCATRTFTPASAA